MDDLRSLRHPFGEVSCEAEVRILGDKYREYYFDHVPFSSSSLDKECYLIIGRRGSGKTSLVHYYSFQKKEPFSVYVDVDEPKLFQKFISKIAKCSASSDEIAIPRCVSIWEYLIWSLTFFELRGENATICEASILSADGMTPSGIIKEILKKLINKYIDDDKCELSDDIESFLANNLVNSAKKEVLKITKESKIIIAIDTLEDYAVNDESMMRAAASLIECASIFNSKYMDKGIHIKLFMSAEVFPYLLESVISNPGKHVRDPIYLHWRPKDLMRLICWRYFKYLKAFDQFLPRVCRDIEWDNYTDVLKKAWQPYFGKSITNRKGLLENSFPYILRHTQMRPRQMILLCNQIAKAAKANKEYPRFSPDVIRTTIRSHERSLANEVINSYKSVYPNVGSIVDALSGEKMLFRGSSLEKIAHRTASAWGGEYSPLRFKRLICELGIVGKVRKIDQQSKIISADYEYNMEGRLIINENDECVIHPMFYERLSTDTQDHLIVYPFPDHSAYTDLYDDE